MLCSTREQAKRNGPLRLSLCNGSHWCVVVSFVGGQTREDIRNRNESNLRDEVERLRSSAACCAAPSEFECAHPCSSLCAVARANDGRECPNRLRFRRFQRGERARIDQR
jgi:hypothetical protein